MFLTHTATGDLIRIDKIDELINPCCAILEGRDQSGEEEQDLDHYNKSELVFPSGEPLPRCWTDVNYRVPLTEEPAQR